MAEVKDETKTLLDDPVNHALLKAGEAGLVGLPFTHRPWELLAKIAHEQHAAPELTSDEARTRVAELTRSGAVRYSRWILETGKLVGKTNTALVALSIHSTQENIKRAADVLTGHPGVSHCYLRGDKGYNVWFTL